MASIRTLKKDINYLAYELLTEAFAYKHFHPELDENKLDEAIRNMVKLRNEILQRINHPEPFESPAEQKQHYRKIHEDMVRLVEVIDDLDK
jgi:methionyl-tRNA synthetase